MEKRFLSDVYEWDSQNWSKSFEVWKPILKSEKKLKCLEIGSRRGGLSLLMASLGHDVTCSDLADPTKIASPLHERYQLKDQIHYTTVNLTDLKFKEEFDVIVFKSVFGGVVRNEDLELAKKIALQLNNALKPGGSVLFAENSSGSLIHRIARKYFRRWGCSWSYFSLNQYREIFQNFNTVQLETYGFWSAFAIGNKTRVLLSYLDQLTCPFIPKSKKYIVFGVAQKN